MSSSSDDYGARIRDMEVRFEIMDNRLDRIDYSMNKINETMEVVLEKFMELNGKIDKQGQRIDEMDTRLSIGDSERLEELKRVEREIDANIDNASDSSASKNDSVKKDKRKSVFLREAASIDAGKSAQRQVVIHMEPPSHKHIFLDSMELSDLQNLLFSGSNTNR